MRIVAYGLLWLFGVTNIEAPGTQAAARQPDSLEAKLRPLVQPILDKKQSVGLVVGVIDGGSKRVFGFGREAAGGAKAPDGSTVFEIGSVTKVFTSLALAQMVEEKLVRLDDPVKRYLPDDVKIASRNGREVTLEDLATHTFGLPRVPLKLLLTGLGASDPYANYKDKDLYAFLKIWKPSQDIGSRWAYSNVGAGLLGHALARRAGLDYGQLIASRITGPLGMKDTTLTLSRAQEQRLAQPYEFGAKPAARWTFDVLAGCGALHSTADDLLVFVSAELGIKDSKLRAAMETTQQPRRETGVDGLRIGLGWLVKKPTKPDHGKYELVWHNGGTAGYSSFVGFSKETKTAVVVLANTGPSAASLGVVDTLGVRVLRILNEKSDRN